MCAARRSLKIYNSLKVHKCIISSSTHLFSTQNRPCPTVASRSDSGALGSIASPQVRRRVADSASRYTDASLVLWYSPCLGTKKRHSTYKSCNSDSVLNRIGPTFSRILLMKKQDWIEHVSLVKFIQNCKCYDRNLSNEWVMSMG